MLLSIANLHAQQQRRDSTAPNILRMVPMIVGFGGGDLVMSQQIRFGWVYLSCLMWRLGDLTMKVKHDKSLGPLGLPPHSCEHANWPVTLLCVDAGAPHQASTKGRKCL